MDLKKLPISIFNKHIRFQFVFNENICIHSLYNHLVPFPHTINDTETLYYLVYYRFIGIYDVLTRKPIFGILYKYHLNKLISLDVGYFYNIQIQGTGISTFGNILNYIAIQNIYIGTFHNGKLHGPGFVEEIGSGYGTDSCDNIKLSGEWENGKLLFEYNNFSNIVLQEHTFIEQKWLLFEIKLQKMFSNYSNIIIKTTPELIQQQNDLYDAQLSPIYVDSTRIDTCWHFYIHLINVIQFVLIE